MDTTQRAKPSTALKLSTFPFWNQVNLNCRLSSTECHSTPAAFLIARKKFDQIRVSPGEKPRGRAGAILPHPSAATQRCSRRTSDAQRRRIRRARLARAARRSHLAQPGLECLPREKCTRVQPRSVSRCAPPPQSSSRQSSSTGGRRARTSRRP